MKKERFSRRGQKLHLPSPATERFNSFLYSERYFTMPEDFYRLMSSTDAQLLGFLLNVRGIVEALGKMEPGGWFYCTAEDIHRRIGFSPDTQTRALSAFPF